MDVIDELKRVLSGKHDSKFQRQKLAELLGKSNATVTSILNRTRPLKVDELPIIYKFIGKDPTKRLIQVVGHVGAGYEVFAYDDHAQGGGLDEIEAPPDADEDTFAVEIRGTSMEPAYYDGDYLIYHDHRSGSDISELSGEECVVRLTDGRMFVKVLVPGTIPGCWTLYSYNAPPLVNEDVEWAARIGWVRRARRQGARIGRT
ncbi:S24 family peptidase [Xanthobacter sp. DSM 24535]|uniref:S24 family peptidase n=1 Tax=Roseixanthobacter psychrophilus TaxID=3119917 RepID=UPI0037291159